MRKENYYRNGEEPQAGDKVIFHKDEMRLRTLYGSEVFTVREIRTYLDNPYILLTDKRFSSDYDFFPNRFELVSRDGYPPIVGIKEEKAPSSNDGRTTCFWCQSPTKPIPGFNSTYDVCSKCGK